MSATVRKRASRKAGGGKAGTKKKDSFILKHSHDTPAEKKALLMATFFRRDSSLKENSAPRQNSESNVRVCNLSPSSALQRLHISKKPSGPSKSRRRLIQNQTINQVKEEKKLITDYFPVRRSNRKTQKTLLEEKHDDIKQAILSGRDDGLEVHYFGSKGRGVVVKRLYHKGEFIVEYAGDLIDLEEAKLRELQYAEDQNTGCYMYYFSHKGQQYCIDATAESGRLGRLINHSRLESNLTTKTFELEDKPHLILIAKRDIVKGEELLYDYGDRSKVSLQYHPWLSS